MPYIVEMNDTELRAAMIEAANGGVPLGEEMAGRLNRWLGETWGERVNGDDCRYVTPLDMAYRVAWDEEADVPAMLALADEAFLVAARGLCDEVFRDDPELSLAAACSFDVSAGDGREAWVVNEWGGGFIASQPDQESGGLYPSGEEAYAAMKSLGFFASTDITLEHVPAIRAAIAREYEGTQ